ncbi:MAG: hypothetical protein K0R55_4014 [Sporomusa sp.]|nr:hypothetical protein [Sporomusa sp.]
MKTNMKLTGAELGSLWYQYMSDSMLLCVLKHHLAVVEDQEIRKVLDYARTLSENHLQEIQRFMQGEAFPKPAGFTDSDVNLQAPRLFSDPFFLSYIRNMTRLSLQRYGLALTTMARADVRKFYEECVTTAARLSQMATELELSKGLYTRSPYIPIPQEVEFVTDTSFMGSLLGEQRPLLGVELDHIFVNCQSNGIGKALITAFSQVAQSTDIRDYFLQGKELAQKQIDRFSSILISDELPAPMSFDSYVTTSTVPAFSDKLMLAHIVMLNAAGIGNYGISMSVTMRTDVVATYARFLVQIGLYVKDGALMTINNGWAEQPPKAANRKQLVMQR